MSNAVLIRRMLKLAWRYRLGVIRAVLMQSILLAMALSGLGLLGLGVDVLGSGIEGGESQSPRWPFGLEPPDHWSQMAKVNVVAGAILLIAMARFVFDRLNTVWLAMLVESIIIHLRTSVYDKLQRLSFRFFDANESGSIINRVTGDVQMVRMFIDQVMIQVLMMILSLTFFLTYMLSIHARLTLFCLATTPLLWVATWYFGRVVKPAYRQNRRLFDDAIRVLSENIQAVHVVKGFSRQCEEIAKFKHANDRVADQKFWIFKRVAFFTPVIGFLPQINILVMLLYGGWLMGQDVLTIGDLIVFSGLLGQFSNQVGNIAQISNSVQQSLTGAQRVFEVIDAPVEIESKPDAIPLPKSKGLVEFDQVSFEYKDHTPALSDVSITVEPGQCVAILGATGAGKSTLLSLIPRFYDPTSGVIRIDGRDIRDYDLDDLRRNVGIVFQESFLFSNTVAANIAFGHPEATKQQIENAAKIASAHNFILDDLPKGYDSLLREGGMNLSGGQRQRIAIARALLLEPTILLMDDPTAAIDPETEHEILTAMNQAMEGRTTFIVAHRLSTMRRADVVIVLDKGRIVQVGTHRQLMNEQGQYQDAAQLQIADDESKRLLGMPTGEGANE